MHFLLHALDTGQSLGGCTSFLQYTHKFTKRENNARLERYAADSFDVIPSRAFVLTENKTKETRKKSEVSPK